MGPPILQGHAPTRRHPGRRCSSSTAWAPEHEDATPYPAPHIVESADEPSSVSPASIVSLLHAAYTRPMEHLGVLCVLSLCVVGFVVSTKSQLASPIAPDPIADLRDHSVLSLLVHEVQSLRTEVLHLRSLLLELRHQP
ncbi:hypothetical protein SPRG_00325 [Saprolegnia parasitica CBS 223.65]|uniref:Uncharacterized protein n=1 Tax=Saprolegnia parasitica (strain CBS 223.65) TaxID=695850 RepID=A0A067CY86_SAPPC|nr:hypothetical protein SPRG_00325 [Saprolegnia parasitica CBS 223.65]KDO35478.1 hypothetical protein SPRG_00325 [Saprolegnia parasitica CBS 223.65]|eukprot:XP_012193815.1 hypothetical protein SPRG_00325 [Saprolegnia parasitica CBS 223.65]